jgi:hypothetical protein
VHAILNGPPQEKRIGRAVRAAPEKRLGRAVHAILNGPPQEKRIGRAVRAILIGGHGPPYENA